MSGDPAPPSFSSAVHIAQIGTSQGRSAGTIAHPTWDGAALPDEVDATWEGEVQSLTYSANLTGTSPQVNAAVLARQALAGNPSPEVIEIRRATNGLEITGVEDRLRELIVDWHNRGKRPHYLILRLGDNDMNNTTEAGEFLRLARRLRAMARDVWPSVRIIWVGPTTGSPDSTYPAVARAIVVAACQQLAAEDNLSRYVSTEANSHTGGDGIHLGPAGQDQAADDIFTAMVALAA